MSVYASSNGDGDFCGEITYRLTTRSGNVWVVTRRDIAEEAAVNDIEWYNAGYETPENSYIGDLEVVELVIKEKK